MDLLLVQPCEEHYLICRPWFESKETTKWLTSPLRLGRYPRIIHDKLSSDRSNRVFFITVQSAALGLAGLLGLDRIDRKAEVWYLIGEDRNRGKDYASEALRLLSGFATEGLGLISLYAHVSVHNFPSIRVLEKCGFQYVGKLRKAFYINGSYQDLLLYDWIP